MATQMPDQDLLSLALSTTDPAQLLARAKESLLNQPDDALALAAQAVALEKRNDQADRAEVLALLMKACDEAWDNLSIWTRIAHAVNSLGLSEGFLDELKGRANRTDSTAHHWLLLGRFQWFLDRNDDAVASLTEATARDASSDLAWFDLARAAVDAQKPDVALDAMSQMVRLDPENESVPIFVALKVAALTIAQRPTEALDVWRAQQPSLNLIEVQRRGIQLAEALLGSKPPHTEESLEVINQIEPVIAPPQNRWPVLRVKAQALIIATKYDEALAVLETADASAADEQERGGVRFWQAVALERAGRIDKALACTDDALSLKLSEDVAAMIILVRARLLISKGEYQRAIEDLKAIKPELLPEELRPEFTLHQGIAFAGLGKNDLALALLEEARKVYQNTEVLASVLYWEGRVLTGLKRYEDALAAFAEAYKAGFPSTETYALRVGEAAALQGMGRINDAIEKLASAIELSQNKMVAAELLISKASLLSLQGKVDAAFAALDSAQNLSPETVNQVRVELEKAAIAQAVGKAADALKSADAALAALGEQDDMNGVRVRALGIRAWALRTQGDYASALDAVERIERLDPTVNEDLDFIIFRWETLLMLGRNDDALELIQNTINGHSALAGHPFLRVALGETLRRMGEVERYFAELAEATHVPPDHADDPRAFLAAAFAGLGTRRWKEASDAIEQLKNLDESFFGSPLLRVVRGLVLAGMGNFREALGLVQDDPDMLSPLRIMAAQARSLALSETGDFDQAIVALDQIVALAAESPEIDPLVSVFAVCMKANCLARLNRYKAALAALSEIGKLTPSAGMAQLVGFIVGMTRSMILNRLGQNDQALVAINAAIQAEEMVGAQFPQDFFEPGRSLWIKGFILFDSGREEEALDIFEQAQLTGLPGNDALVWQGRALLALEDPDRALPVFDAAVKNAANRQDFPQQFDALVGKGRALHDAHTYDAAVAAYREALRVGGANAEADAHYWRRLGEAYYALERYEAALRGFRRGWQIERNANLARGISAVLIRQKQYGEARRFIEQEARQLATQDPALKYNRGVALWALGKKEQAKRIIKEASDAGVIEATESAQALKTKRDAAGGWWETWFGEGVGRTRFIVGISLLVAVASALAAPALAYFQKTLDWKAPLVPAAVGLILLLIPSIKGLSLSTEGVKLDIEPSAVGDDGDAPKLDLLPLGSGFYLFTASLQPLSKPPADLQRPELDDASLRTIYSAPQVSSSPVKMI